MKTLSARNEPSADAGDLKDADYRLIGTEATTSLLARSGIEPDTTVVFHGYAPALGFWLMKLYGHQDAHILDCSRDAWRDEGHPVARCRFWRKLT